MNEEKLSWKEKYAAILLLLIGSFFLITQTLDILSSKNERLSVVDKNVSIRMDQLLIDLKTYVIIVLAILGGIFLLRQKTIGWILGLPVLTWYALLVANGVLMGIRLHTYDAGFIMAVAGFLLIAAALLFLYSKQGRVKYKVGKRSYLPTFLILAAIIAMFFLL